MISDMVLGRAIFRGEGDSTCTSVFCPDDSGDRLSRGSLLASRPVLSTTSDS